MFRQPGRGGTSSVLKKVDSLLKGGGRTDSTSRQLRSEATEEDDITSYLSGLAKKTAVQARGDASEDRAQTLAESAGGSKFLKKKAVVSEAPKADDATQKLPAKTPAKTHHAAATSSTQQRGTAAADISQKVSKETGVHAGGQRFLKQAGQPHREHSLPPPPKGHSASSPRHAARKGLEPHSVLESSDEGMTTFMDGLTTTSNSARTSEEFDREVPAKAKPASSQGQPAVPWQQGTTRSPAAAAAAITTVVARSLPEPVAEVLSSSDVESVEENSVISSPRAAVTSTVRDFAVSESITQGGGSSQHGLRIFGIDALQPADSDLRSSRDLTRAHAVSEIESIQTAPLTPSGFLAHGRLNAAVDNSDYDDESLKTEEVASGPTDGDSIRSSVPHVVAAVPAGSSVAKQQTAAIDSLKLRKEQNSAKDSYSEDFEKTLATTDEEETLSSRSSSVSSRDGQLSRAEMNRGQSFSSASERRQRDRSPQYADRSLSTQSYSYSSETWHSVTPSSPRRRGRRRSSSESPLSKASTEPRRNGSHRDAETRSRRVATADVCMQTGLDLEEAILRCHWNSPWGFSSLRLPVSAAMSSSPTAIPMQQAAGQELPYAPALADLLARQVSLTRDFIETQKRLHRCLVDSLGDSSYRYTTLEDTKQYISTHRRRTITFDEAVRQVKEDMNIQ